MTSEIRTNSLKSRAGLSTVTLTDSGPIFSGITTFLDNSIFNVGNINATGVVTATSFSGSGANLTGITVPGGGTGLDLNDNVKIRIGTGTDLEIYHDGSHSHINEETGNLLVGVEGEFQVLNRQENEFRIRAHNNGGVDLYYDHSKKFETKSFGGLISGNLDATGNFVIPNDTGKFLAGASNDLQFFHSSNENFIQANTTGQDIFFKTSVSSSGDTSSMVVRSDGSITHPDNIKVKFGASDDLQIFHDGTDSKITNGTGNLIITQSNGIIRLDPKTNENGILIRPDGSVELYHDNVKQFSTITDGLVLNNDKRITRNGNSNNTILEVKNAQYAKSLYIGGWDQGTNSAGISRIRNSNDNLHLDAGANGEMYLQAYSAGVIYGRHFRPMSNDTYDIGGSGIRWDDIFATNGTINTSDRNEKNTITESDLGLSFVNKLKPVSYKFNGKTRTHYGLIAQDIETVLSDISKPSTDFAGFIKTDLPDEYYQESEPNIPEGKKEGDLKSAAHTEYGLRYTEFISPLIKAVQELNTKVETLEQDNIALRARVTNLEGN